MEGKKHELLLSFFFFIYYSDLLYLTVVRTCIGLLKHTIIHKDTHSVRFLWTREIVPTQITPPDNTRYSQETDIHNPCGIRTLKLSKLVASDLRLNLHGHRDLRHLIPIRKYLNSVSGKHDIKELHNTTKFGTVHMLREVLT